MDKITVIPLPSKGQAHVYDLAGDLHDDHMCWNSFDMMIELAKKVPFKKRRLILGGDVNDLNQFMKKGDLYQRWKKHPQRMDEFFIPVIKDVFAFTNSMLDDLQKIYPWITYFEGNHELRLRTFMEHDCPDAYKHNFILEKGLKLKERGIPFIPYNHWLKIGKVFLTHGMYHGMSALKKHYDACGGTVIYFHVHTLEIKAFIRIGDTIKSHSMPCMSDLAPDWLKDKENQWEKGFAKLCIKSNGGFHFYPYINKDEEIVLPSGKILRPPNENQ